MLPSDLAKFDPKFVAWCFASFAQVAHQLLRGNDTGCFSTEQYRHAYARFVEEVLDGHTNRQRLDAISSDWPRKLLQSVVCIREVRPDVWAHAEDLASGSHSGAVELLDA